MNPEDFKIGKRFLIYLNYKESLISLREGIVIDKKFNKKGGRDTKNPYIISRLGKGLALKMKVDKRGFFGEELEKVKPYTTSFLYDNIVDGYEIENFKF